MAITTIIFGDLLIILGIWGYFASDRTSLTALIPTAFGALLNVAGALALKEKLKKHAMHAAMLVALLAFLGSMRGLAQLPTLMQGGEVARPNAVIAQSIMAAMMFAYLSIGIRSFIDARRKRAA